MNNILIIGGAGFIGSHLIKKLLVDNNNIICIDNLITGNLNNIRDFCNNPNFNFIKYDITDKLVINLFNDIKFSEIYHLASIASPDKYKLNSLETLNTNVIGTINILELTKKNNCKLLFTSTSEVYGDPWIYPQNEEYFGNVNTMGERSCYDEGKRVAETYIYEYKKLYNLDIKIVRLFNTYGPNMNINDGRVITNFIRSFINKEPLVIYGDGNQTRSFCYIDDTLDGIIKMMNSEYNNPINIGNPNYELSIKELAEIFITLDDKLCIKYIDKTQDDPKIRRPDIFKAEKYLNWKPIISLEDGIQKTIKSFINI